MFAETLLYSTIFIAGLGSFFSPCVVPLLPVYIAFFSGGLDKENKRPLTIWLRTMGRAALFVLGISTTFFALGFGLGFMGNLLNPRTLAMIMGFVVVLLGIHQMELFSFKRLQAEKKIHFQPKQSGLLSSYLLGLSFSFGWSPCIGPILGTILGLAATQSSVSESALMILVYSLGFMMPFLLLAATSTLLLRYTKRLQPYLPLIKRIGGAIIVIMGLLMLFDKVNYLTRFFL